MLYVFMLAESLRARRLPGPGEEKPRLFDSLPDHNPPRELKGRRRFPYFLVRNPLKNLDSEK
jgi:hypothetical protein